MFSGKLITRLSEHVK